MATGNLKRVLTVQVAGLFAATFSFNAVANGIAPGFDLFQSATSTIPVAPIGLHPGGTVDFQGIPIGFGLTDTIVERKEGIPNPPFVPGGGVGSGVVNIEVVALSLRSVNPVLGGSEPYLWGIINTIPGIVNPAVLPVTDMSMSQGQMLIRHENPDADPNQGTFDVGLGGLLDFDITWEFWSGDMTVALTDLNATDTINQNGTGTWSHTNPGHPTDPALPSGDFYVTSIMHTGPHNIVPEIDASRGPITLAVLLGVLALIRERMQSRADGTA